jgi:hypothetical protein
MKNKPCSLKTSHWASIAVLGIAFCASEAFARGDGRGRPDGERDEVKHVEPRESKQGDQAARHNTEHRKQAEHATTENTASGLHVQPGAAVSGDGARHAVNNVQHVEGRDRVSHLNTNHAAQNIPFTRRWYANHPNTWQAAHPMADTWAAASLTSAVDWLGIADNSVDDDSSTVTANSADTSTDTSSQASDNDSDDDPSSSDAGAATQLAQSGSAQVGNDVEFLPLGVYALAPPDQDDATAMLQLAVSKDGMVRGSYYDLVSDQAHPIQGAVDKKTERVAFTIGQKGTTVFETKLADLTGPEGEVSLHFRDGEASDWMLARFESTVPEKSSKD